MSPTQRTGEDHQGEVASAPSVVALGSSGVKDERVCVRPEEPRPGAKEGIEAVHCAQVLRQSRMGMQRWEHLKTSTLPWSGRALDAAPWQHGPGANLPGWGQPLHQGSACFRTLCDQL